jgi:outer membrane protein assembly factor BamD
MRKIVLLIIVCMLAFVSCSKKAGPNMTAGESMKIGMEYFQRGKYEQSISYFEHTLMEAETPEMASQAQLFMADAYFLDKKYVEAIPAYEQYLEIYSNSPDAGTAMLRLGLSHYALVSTIDRDMSAVEGALDAFTKLRDRFPSYTREFELNKKIVELRSMLSARELYVAKFYYRIGSPDAGETRLKYLIANYSDTESYDEALYFYGNKLAEQDGREAEAVKYYQMLVKERPDSKYVIDVARKLTSLLAKITIQLEEQQKTKEN